MTYRTIGVFFRLIRADPIRRADPFRLGFVVYWVVVQLMELCLFGKLCRYR